MKITQEFVNHCYSSCEMFELFDLSSWSLYFLFPLTKGTPPLQPARRLRRRLTDSQQFHIRFSLQGRRFAGWRKAGGAEIGFGRIPKFVLKTCVRRKE